MDFGLSSLLPLIAQLIIGKMGGAGNAQGQYENMLGSQAEQSAYGFSRQKMLDSLMQPNIEMQAGRQGQMLRDMTPFSPTAYLDRLMGDTRNTFTGQGSAPPPLSAAPYSYGTGDISTGIGFNTDTDGGKISKNPFEERYNELSENPPENLADVLGGDNWEPYYWNWVNNVIEQGNFEEASKSPFYSENLFKDTDLSKYNLIMSDDPDKRRWVIRSEGETEDDRRPFTGREEVTGPGGNYPYSQYTTSANVNAPGGEFGWTPMRSRSDIMGLGNRLNQITNKPGIDFNAPPPRAQELAGGIPQIAQGQTGNVQNIQALLPLMLASMKNRKPLTGGLIR